MPLEAGGEQFGPMHDRCFSAAGSPSAMIAPAAPMQAARILIADDQSDVLEALKLLLKGEGYVIDLADSPARALNMQERTEYDVALIDLNYARDTTSGQEGLDLLARLRTADDTLPVIVMTAWSSVDLA